MRDVYNARADYAAGWAARTLYSAYVQRGNQYMVAKNCQAALDDYRRALVIKKEEIVGFENGSVAKTAQT